MAGKVGVLRAQGKVVIVRRQPPARRSASDEGRTLIVPIETSAVRRRILRFAQDDKRSYWNPPGVRP